MPGRNGGTLRAGGGRPDRSKEVRTVHQIIKDGSVDAARALLEQARKGNIRACELVLAYAIGRPLDRLELSGELTTRAVPEGLTDHERLLLRSAIDAELERRGSEVMG